jgi:hypothetical protein
MTEAIATDSTPTPTLAPAPVAAPTAPVVAAAPLPGDPAAPAAPSAPVEPAPFYESLPETWRDDMVKSLGIQDAVDLEKRSNQLGRIPDFKTLTKSYFSAQDKISSGMVPVGLPENATPAQLIEYREANNVPTKADEYIGGLDSGLVLGEDDQAILGEVFNVAHGLNISSKTVGALANAFLNARASVGVAATDQDGVDTQMAQQQLADAWGQDYQTNLNMVRGLTNKLPENIREDFLAARMPDGKAMFNSPEILIFLSDLSRKDNPAGTVVPNSANPTQAIDDEIASLEAKMGTDAWYKDKAGQKRYMQLAQARDNMG